MLRSRVLALLLFALFATACGKTDEKASAETQPPTVDMTAATAYGSVAEVSAYLQTINPHITTFSKLQQEYEEALASTKQGNADRRGTGRNLAAAVRPGLQSVLEELDNIEPPPLLAPFHRDTRKMLVTRIDALARTIEGWEVEQAEGDFEAIYQDAETKYESANQLILQLNRQMDSINTTVQEAAGSP